MNSIVEAAILAFEEGWSPIPIRKGEKRPAHSDWTNTRYKTKNELESAFSKYNLGVLLGDASKGLIDIDLDSDEARMLADGFLPVTRMVHGRKSSPNSHYWYRVEDWSLRVKKFVDPIAKGENQVLLEIRGTGGQTLLPPSVHPSGEVYTWQGGKWHPPAVVSYKELDKQTRWLAAASLLARYWPGQGKRHDASLALAGGLLTLGDEDLAHDAEAFLASVALAAGDEEGFDRQQDVISTRELLKKNKKVRGWPTLSKLIDRRVVKQVVEWLSVEEEELGVAGDGEFRRVDLQEYMTGERKPHPMLIPELIYEGKVTWLQGEPGNGKTLFALWLAIQCMQQGYRVMFIDEESGPLMTADRLVGLGATIDLTNDFFWYYPFSSINVMDPEHRHNFNQALEESKPNIIMFDSVSDILAQAGLRENENDDVNMLVKHFVDPLRNQNVASLFIDHMAKSSVDSGWARGAGSKKAKTDASWTFTAPKAFDKQTVGRVSLKRSKDRLGQLPATHLFKMGGNGEGRIIVEATELVRNLITDIGDETVINIIELLKNKAYNEDKAFKTTEIATKVTGSTNKIYAALDWIEKNLAETPIEVVKKGKSKFWFYAGDIEIDWEATK